MANASKSPQAGAACGRATWPFLGGIREMLSAPIRTDIHGKTTPTAELERLGVGGFDMGSLLVILVGIRHTRIQDKKGEGPCCSFFMPSTSRNQMQNRVSTVWCAVFNGPAATGHGYLDVLGGKNCVIRDFFNHGCRVCRNRARGWRNGFMCGPDARRASQWPGGGVALAIGNRLFLVAATKMAFTGSWHAHGACEGPRFLSCLPQERYADLHEQHLCYVHE